MKKHSLSVILITGLLTASLPLQTYAAPSDGTATEKKEKRTNVGIKGGFNSSMYFSSHLEVEGEVMNTTENWYKVGYWGAVFFRYNMKRHFIQPELTFSVSKGSIFFNRNQNHPDSENARADINTTIRSFDLPVLYGYNFIKKDEYGMSFFIGPKLSYVWSQKSDTEFSEFTQNNISEDLYPLHYSAVLGLGVNISNIFFDFRYEIGLHNISKSITYTSKVNGITTTEHNLIADRHKNVLSFSLGVMF